MLYPLTFTPILKERVWGGRNLELLYGKLLPPGKVIGESWEIVDRPHDTSVIANGPLAGKDLPWLLENHGREVLGDASLSGGRFPLLAKILDAGDRLSLQVHPPAIVAARYGGEPKAELWYVASAQAGAELFVGIKRGVTRDQFTRKIRDGSVADCLHRLKVVAGDSMFLPSGRLHAIGGGLVVFEIQQNSDTTYRVFDWNRLGLDGRPRDLQIEQSLESIDFADFEPALVATEYEALAPDRFRLLVENEWLSVREHRLPPGSRAELAWGRFRILGLVRGDLTVEHDGPQNRLRPGEFCLIPAALKHVSVQSSVGATFLESAVGTGVA